MKTQPGTRRRYTAEFKAQLVREILQEQKSVAQLAAEHGIHPNQLYQWRDLAIQTLPALFSDQSTKEQAQREEAHLKLVHDLYAQIGKLTTQLEWLKKKAGQHDE
jgi:transposase-like protein